MRDRRKLLTASTTFAIALGILGLPVLADEVVGRITKVNASANSITVEKKGSGEAVDLKVTKATEWVTPKGDQKINLKRVEKLVEKAKNGVLVEITEQAGVASKIKIEARKKKGAA